MTKNRAVRWLTFAVLLISLSAAAYSQVVISVRFGPPALPVYTQPVCPGAGYLFTPGYWSWDDDAGYYWVPGTWVLAPVGLLWTPGYWGWNDGVYAWNAGYWGPQIGFYGGINYGFGYGGDGFYGGEWRNGAFFYNRSVTNINVTNITNVYERTVVVNNNHFAFNGPGGVSARPTPAQETYAHEQHTAPLPAQTEQRQAASQNRALFASENHGRPAIAATAKPGEFSGRGVVAAKAAGAAYQAPKMSPKQARVAPGENHGNAGAENRGNENRGAENRGAENHAQPQQNRAEKQQQNRENKAEQQQQKQNRQAEQREQKQAKPERQQQMRQEPAREAQPKQQEKPQQTHAAPAREAQQPKQQPKPQAKPAPSRAPAEKKEAPPKKEEHGPGL